VTDADPPVLYTAAEAAMILRVKRSWLERQAARRKVPFTMLGRSYRFSAVHIAIIIEIYEHAPAPHWSAPTRPGHSRSSSVTDGEQAAPSPPLQPRPRGQVRRGPRDAHLTA
jgi:excisionase family DNA binding protein